MKDKYLITILLGLLCGQLRCVASDFVVNGVTYRVLSSSEKTVEVVRNDTLPYTGQITLSNTVKKDGISYIVTTIGDGAFLCCSHLQSITLPTSLKRIGDRAFYGCEKLIQAEIPSNVDSIGHYAFTDCKAMTQINLPSSLVYIGRAAFKGCIGLKNIYSANTQPPILSGSYMMDSFAGTNHETIVVTVPIGCAKLYHAAKGWSLFAYITDHSLSPGEMFLSMSIEGDGCIVYNNEEMFDGNTCTLSQGEPVEVVIRPGEDNIVQHVYLNGNDYVDTMRGDTLTCPAITENTLLEAVFVQRNAYLTLCYGENGSLEIDVTENRPITIHIKPNDGWNIKKITLDDENVTDWMDSNNTITIEKVRRGMEFSVILENANQIKGDINHDSYVNILDVTEIINIILGK